MEKLNEILNIDSYKVKVDATQTIVPQTGDAVEDVDFDSVRTNQYELLAQGKDAINTAMLIVNETQSPRAMEVLSNLLKTVSDMNKQLLTISKDKADIKATKDNKTSLSLPQQNIQNAVFVGSSSDLNRKVVEIINDKVNTTTN